MEVRSTPLFTDANAFAYYRFRTGALTADSIGANTLTAGGVPLGVAGKYGKGIRFNVASYYSTSIANFTVGGSWGLNIWAKNYFQGMFSNNAGGYEYYGGINTVNMYFNIMFSDGSNASYNVGLPVGFNNAKWNMYTFQVQSSGSDTIGAIHLNSRLLYTATHTGKFPAVMVAPFYLSYFHVEGKNGSYGDIDDVYFKRSTFTTKQLKQMYNNMLGGALLPLIG